MPEGKSFFDLPFDPEVDLPYEPPKVTWEEELEVGPTLGASNVVGQPQCGGG
jgi:hypothetical protein